MVILTVTAPPCGHNRNDIPMETVRHSAPPWPRWELHPLMVIYGHSAPSGHNRNDIPMETMTVTEPPSGHSGNYNTTMVMDGTQRPPVATTGMTPLNIQHTQWPQ